MSTTTQSEILERPKNIKTGKQNAMPIRIKKETKKALTKWVRKANSKSFGKRILVDDIVSLGLNLIEPQHIEHLQNT